MAPQFYCDEVRGQSISWPEHWQKIKEDRQTDGGLFGAAYRVEENFAKPDHDAWDDSQSLNKNRSESLISSLSELLKTTEIYLISVEHAANHENIVMKLYLASICSFLQNTIFQCESCLPTLLAWSGLARLAGLARLCKRTNKNGRTAHAQHIVTFWAAAWLKTRTKKVTFISAAKLFRFQLSTRWTK